MSDTPFIACLEVYLDGQTQRFPLGANQICRIGRATRNTMVLPSAQVSRDHALADCPDGRDCYITDLGSLNGTHVNGNRITAPCLLHDGDLVSVGEFRIAFRQITPGGGGSDEASMSETAVKVVNAEITVLVADIVAFTELSQTVGAEKLTEVVGAFHRDCGALLQTHGAWGQKYIGDAVMAIWTHKTDAPGAQFVQRALLSAHGIHGVAETLHRRFRLDRRVRLSAAINSGFASLGNLGSEAVSDYTALGDTVNKAFRLESATREVGCEVLVGQASFAHLDQVSRDQLSAAGQRHEVMLKGYVSAATAYGIRFADLTTVLGLGKRTILL